MTNDYQKLLEREEWKLKRQVLLDRFNHSCSECGRNRHQRVIDVHHRYYRLGWLPWEYPDAAFVVLCREHHEGLHRKVRIPVFDENGQPIAQQAPCGKCDGSGYIPAYHHVAEGLCFRCWGSGLDFEKLLIGRTQAQLDSRPIIPKSVPGSGPAS